MNNWFTGGFASQQHIPHFLAWAWPAKKATFKAAQDFHKTLHGSFVSSSWHRKQLKEQTENFTCNSMVQILQSSLKEERWHERLLTNWVAIKLVYQQFNLLLNWGFQETLPLIDLQIILDNASQFVATQCHHTKHLPKTRPSNYPLSWF